MRDEDLTDTAPVIMGEKTSVVFESLELKINERGEIILSPDKALRCPTLFMTDRGSEILIEAVFHGRTEIRRLGQHPISSFRFGIQLDVHQSHSVVGHVFGIGHGICGRRHRGGKRDRK